MPNTFNSGSGIVGNPAIGSNGLDNLLGGLPGLGYTASVSVVYTAGSTNTLVITDNTTYGSYTGTSDGLAAMNVNVTDDEGRQVVGQTTTTGSGGALTISTSTLDFTETGVIVKVSIVTTEGLHFEGSSLPILAAGTYAITNWKTSLG
jgi:hypothetical protein